MRAAKETLHNLRASGDASGLRELQPSVVEILTASTHGEMGSSAEELLRSAPHGWMGNWLVRILALEAALLSLAGRQGHQPTATLRMSEVRARGAIVLLARALRRHVRHAVDVIGTIYKWYVDEELVMAALPGLRERHPELNDQVRPYLFKNSMARAAKKSSANASNEWPESAPRSTKPGSSPRGHCSRCSNALRASDPNGNP